jgi:hypothetical protein
MSNGSGVLQLGDHHVVAPGSMFSYQSET